MRDIKFRAWLKAQKRMATDGEFQDMRVWDLGAFENEIFMQYTGLKDRNGVEIYEGDIVKFKEDIASVEYRHTEFLAMDNTEHCWNILNNDCEVIGNIYENPELVRLEEEL